MTPRPSIPDITLAVVSVAVLLVFDLPLFLLGIGFATFRGQDVKRYHGLSFGPRLELFAIRRSLEVMPISITRFITDIGLPDDILKSERYSPFAKNLYRPITGDGFRGVWIIQGEFQRSTDIEVEKPATPNFDSDPRNSDIVIYFLHGGGYYSSSPATYLTYLLRLAEIIKRSGKSISIFALDYDLAPEAKFPTQLLQARKGYDWLLKSTKDGGVGIPKENLLLMGDSAGGHLSLSLLVDLWKPFKVDGEGQERRLSSAESVNNEHNHRPGLGVALLSPWISLFHTPGSFSRNAYTDVLSKSFLYETAKRFLPLTYGARVPAQTAPWLEFLDPKSDIQWDAVLPEWVWVCAGRKEILYDDIVKWFKDRQQDCTGRRNGRDRLEGEMDRNEPHIYPILKTMDQKCRKDFCEKRMESVSEFEDFAAIDRIGHAILRNKERVSLG